TGHPDPGAPGAVARSVADALARTGHPDPGAPGAVARSVADALARRPRGEVPTVEQIQDLVEAQLVAAGLDDVARAYIVYRQHHAEVRAAKGLIGVRDELKLSVAAVTVLAERYLLRDDQGRPKESTGEMMDRVAHCVAAAEDGYRRGSSAMWAQRFSTVLRRLEFLPNSPTLMNAGTEMGLLAGCFVLPVEDSLRSIFTTLAHSAEIHQAGGGTGYTFTHLRPAGDRVAGTGGTASGPMSFLGLFDTAAGVIALGGRRRSASMAVLDVSHPDIYDFVTTKADSPGELTHFNLSVGVGDAFLRAVERDGTHRLINPRTHKTVARVAAADLFATICEAAHRCGDPGLVFLDTINRANPTPARGRIEATNPCGEVPLLPYESCNLGSVNLARMVSGGSVDWDRLAEVAELAVRFLDDVIDVSRYPIPELDAATRATRKIGLGVMGLAEMLAGLGIPYDSERGVRLAGRIARSLQQAAHAASMRLAEDRGPFPAFDNSRFAGSAPRRHAQLTSIAPTGTISLIAGTTAGIEPMFAIAYTRSVIGRRLLEVNPCFDRLARDRGFYRDDLIAEIGQRGGVRGYPHLPAEVRAAFPIAAEITPEWHLRMQAAVQRHVDAAVSKTVNLPADATVDDVRAIYLAAWRAKVKGITVYRYGSRPGQVLSYVAPAQPLLSVDPTFSGGCAGRTCEF
ncbi:adenosylcobalamin-dependent ribonucleoside-diphosphate reductase, partial [Mycobacterium lacus]|uniref:adenosylcobalamin-dependent ribonucleoside-diphosphate reductase n=1 Tax=Mycobacterium lacus TaxID=169765 RepID=UPI0021F32846